MLWRNYVFRRGIAVHDMWDRSYEDREVRLLYIAGRGFDSRAVQVLRSFMDGLSSGACQPSSAELLLVGFTGYELDSTLQAQTEINAKVLEQLFSAIGSVDAVTFGSSAAGEDDLSASNALRIGTEQVLARIKDHTDIVLDVSSFPRVVYLALMTGILRRLVADRDAPGALAAGGVNFQVLVGEDAALDAQIRSEDPSNDLVLIPGYSSALHAESVQDWPLVWFPILGENRVAQFEKVMATIPENAEICPVLPHPSRDPRRADKLLVEYRRSLFDTGKAPTSNIIYAHENHPFEAYRQLLQAMRRYRDSLRIVGGCRLVMTPLASKLITLGAGLSCFDMRPHRQEDDYGVAIPYAEPTRYIASTGTLNASKPVISSLLLTGSAYS